MEYTAPDWAGSPQQECYFEVIKDGRVLEISDIFKSSTVAIGRADCFIKMEHSSISRYHALIQFKNDGSKYLYDLGSTHGTFLNKQRISPRTYCKIKVGDMIKFGASSRIYFFQGEQEQAPKLQETGISWGFRQDAYVGDEWEGKDLQLGAIDRSTIPNDAFYLKDPRSVLKSWLEGRGEELAIRTSHEDDDQVISKIILPVTTIKGDLIAIGFGRNKKKAERDACLEACAKLDKLEILRGSGPSRKKTALEEFGDDTDTFFDRTTQKSKPVLEKEPEKIENYDSLLDQKIELEDSIQNTNDEIRQRTETFANMEASDDDLDAYMQDVQKKIITQEQKALTNKLQELQKKMERLDALIILAKPSSQSLVDDINTKRQNRSQVEKQVPGQIIKAINEQEHDKIDTKEQQTENEDISQTPVMPDNRPNVHNEALPQVFGAKRKYDNIEDDYVDGVIGNKQNKEEVAQVAKSYGY